MEIYFKKYICSNCRKAKDNCFEIFEYQEGTMYVYRCLNFRKRKIVPSKERRLIDEYFENRNTPTNKEQEELPRDNI